jgi:hypothetical protein
LSFNRISPARLSSIRISGLAENRVRIRQAVLKAQTSLSEIMGCNEKASRREREHRPAMRSRSMCQSAGGRCPDFAPIVLGAPAAQQGRYWERRAKSLLTLARIASRMMPTSSAHCLGADSCWRGPRWTTPSSGSTREANPTTPVFANVGMHWNLPSPADFAGVTKAGPRISRGDVADLRGNGGRKVPRKSTVGADLWDGHARGNQRFVLLPSAGPSRLPLAVRPRGRVSGCPGT